MVLELVAGSSAVADVGLALETWVGPAGCPDDGEKDDIWSLRACSWKPASCGEAVGRRDTLETETRTEPT